MRILLFLLISSCCMAQQEFIGSVKDTEGHPVEQVVVIVSDSLSPETPQHILISDDLGTFKAVLNTSTTYAVKTKHLSFRDTLMYFNTAKANTIAIALSAAEQQLGEVIIKHEKPKIIVKRDTVAFDLSKFSDPNDRKLKDLIEKLPGLTLQEDGVMYFKGQKITKLLVENEEFFGGSTKLGLEHIPADALEKLEVISNYSKSNLLRNNRKTEEQVINLVLKKDRRSINFGNISAGSNFDQFYNAQLSFFQFKRKNQNNLIVNANNIAQAMIGNNEAEAFSNIQSELFSLIQTPIAYFGGANEFSKIDSKIAALNIKRIQEHSTWDFLSYYNRVDKEKEFSETVEYLNNNSVDSRIESEKNRHNSFYLRAKNYLANAKKERLFVNMVSITKDDNLNLTASESGLGTRDYKTSDFKDQVSINSVFEEVRAFNTNQTLVYGSNLSYATANADKALSSNQAFLEDQIPWLDQNRYNLDKSSQIDEFNLQLGAIYYYNLNRFHTLSVQNKTTYNASTLDNNQDQLLDNGNTHDLGDLFSSDLRYTKLQSEVVATYGYKRNNWNLSAGSRADLFLIKSKKADLKNDYSDIVFHPFSNLQYNFNSKKQVSFIYTGHINLPEAYHLDDYYTIDNYNAISIGNMDLKRASSQNLSLRYTDYNIAKNYSLNTSTGFQFYKNALERFYVFDDINSTSSYFNQERNGYNFNSRINFFYLFKDWEAGMTLNYSESVRHVLLDRFEKATNRRLHLAPRFKTNFKTLPNLMFRPYVIYSNQSVSSNSRAFTSRGFQSKIDFNFLNHFFVKTGYNYAEIDSDKSFSTLDLEFRFTNKLKSLDIAVVGYNLLGTTYKSNILQSSLIRIENTSLNLGRRLLLTANYIF